MNLLCLLLRILGWFSCIVETFSSLGFLVGYVDMLMKILSKHDHFFLEMMLTVLPSLFISCPCCFNLLYCSHCQIINNDIIIINSYKFTFICVYIQTFVYYWYYEICEWECILKLCNVIALYCYIVHVSRDVNTI